MIHNSLTKKTNRNSYFVVGFAALLVTLLTSCDKAPVVEPEPIIRPVKLISLESNSNIQSFSFPAIIEARSTSELAFQVSGNLSEILVKEGQEVSQNDVLARLDKTTYVNDHKVAQSQFDNANAEYQRAKKLVAQKAIARSVFDQRKSERRIARIKLNNAAKAVDDTELKAPFTGVIAEVLLDEFQTVSSSTPVVALQSTGAAEAVVQIPSSLVAGSGNLEPIRTSVSLDSSPGVDMPAVFHSAATRANESTQTFEVKFAFTPPTDIIILPGMTGTVFGTAEVLGNEQTADAVLVPLNAISTEGENKFSWLVNTENMTVSKQPITVGSGIGDSLLVLSGLSEGDVVVGAGMSYLHEGMTIVPYEN